MEKTLLPNRIAGLVSVMIGIVAIIEGIRLYTVRLSPMVGDHTLPILLGAIMVISGLSFWIKADVFKVVYPDKKSRNIILLTFVLMSLYCLLMVFLGYMISTIVVSIGLLKVFGSYSWKKCILIGSSLSISVYLIFIVLLKMNLPVGILTI